MEQTGLSRSTVREGMKQLSALGVVEIRRGDGSYVSAGLGSSLLEPFLLQLMMSTYDVRDMTELREIIEPNVVLLALEHANPDDLAAIREQLVLMETAIASCQVQDCSQWAKIDIAFHNAIGAATHNNLVEKLYAFILRFFEIPIRRTYQNGQNPASAHALHTEIYHALSQHDRTATQRAVARSIAMWADQYTCQNFNFNGRDEHDH